MKVKRIALVLACIVLLVASIVIIIKYKDEKVSTIDKYQDGIEYVSPNTIELKNSGAHVTFSDVLVSQPQEARKLIVFETMAVTSAIIEKSKIKNINLKAIMQNQTVTYRAMGVFVVSLDSDSLTKESIKDDPKNKLLTIEIEHPKLEAIEIDPNKIVIGRQDNGFLAFGELVLSVDNYVELEKELKKKLEDKLDTVANGQKADAIAREKVKEIYEPVVHAIDPEYRLVVEFKETE